MNKIDLTGTVAIVTGGAQGIGLAVARRLVDSGSTVGLMDMNSELLDAAVADLGGKATALLADITDVNAVATAHDAFVRKTGPVGILVHSAGISGSTVPMHVYDPAEWSKVVTVNLVGTFNVNRAVVPGMIAQNYGRIVNIASVAGKEGNPNASAYSASKAGVIAFTKSVAKELAQHDIAVNCITPAAARTRILEQVSQQHIDYMLSKIPRGRFVELDEIAGMVAWLVSKENSFTTGATFDLSGGRATY